MQWWYIGAASNIAILVFYLEIGLTRRKEVTPSPKA